MNLEGTGVQGYRGEAQGYVVHPCTPGLQAWPALARQARPGPPRADLARLPGKPGACTPTRRSRASNLAPPVLPEKRSWTIILKLEPWPSFILNEKALDLSF